MSSKERLLLLLLAGVNFTHIIDFMIMMPLGAYLMPLLKITPQQFSLLVSAYTLAGAVVGFSAAFFVDRFDRKKVLLVGYIGFVIGTFLCALTTVYELLLLARVIAGSFGGLIGAQVLSIVGDAIPFERRGRAMGIIMGAFSLAAAVGVPVSLFFAQRFYWQMPFLVLVGMGLLLIPLLVVYVPSMAGHIQAREERPRPWAVLTAIWSSGNQQNALLLMSVLMMGHFITIPFIAPYLEFNVGFDKSTVTWMYFLGGSASAFSTPLVGRLADRLGIRRLFGVIMVLAMVPVLLITHLQPIPYYYVLVITTLFFIFAGGRAVLVQAMMASVVSQQQRGGFMSISSSVQQLSSGLAALIAGFIIQEDTNTGKLYHYNYVGYISVSLLLLCIFLARRVQVNKS